jgi:hypothetical protein
MEAVCVSARSYVCPRTLVIFHYVIYLRDIYFK